MASLHKIYVIDNNGANMTSADRDIQMILCNPKYLHMIIMI